MDRDTGLHVPHLGGRAEDTDIRRGQEQTQPSNCWCDCGRLVWDLIISRAPCCHGLMCFLQPSPHTGRQAWQQQGATSSQTPAPKGVAFP